MGCSRACAFLGGLRGVLLPHLALAVTIVWEYPRDIVVSEFVITATHADQPHPSTYRVLPSPVGAWQPLDGPNNPAWYCADVGWLPPGTYTVEIAAERDHMVLDTSLPLTCTMTTSLACIGIPSPEGACVDPSPRPTPTPAAPTPPLPAQPERPQPDVPPVPGTPPAPSPVEPLPPVAEEHTPPPAAPAPLPGPPQAPDTVPEPLLEPESPLDRLRTELAAILATYAARQQQIRATYAQALRKAQTLPTARERNAAKRVAHQAVTSALWTSFGQATQAFFGVLFAWVGTLGTG